MLKICNTTIKSIFEHWALPNFAFNLYNKKFAICKIAKDILEHVNSQNVAVETSKFAKNTFNVFF